MRKVLLVAVVLILGVAGWWWVERWTAPPLPGPPVASPIASTPPSLSAEARGLPTLAPMLRRTMQSVVSITVQAQAAGEDNSLYKDPFYRRYFGGSVPAESVETGANLPAHDVNVSPVGGDRLVSLGFGKIGQVRPLLGLQIEHIQPIGDGFVILSESAKHVELVANLHRFGFDPTDRRLNRRLLRRGLAL